MLQIEYSRKIMLYNKLCKTNKKKKSKRKCPGSIQDRVNFYSSYEEAEPGQEVILYHLRSIARGRARDSLTSENKGAPYRGKKARQRKQLVLLQIFHVNCFIVLYSLLF